MGEKEFRFGNGMVIKESPDFEDLETFKLSEVVDMSSLSERE